jgi:hypothetical protein
MKEDFRVWIRPIRSLVTVAIGLMTSSCFYVWQEPIRYGQTGRPVGSEQPAVPPKPGTLEALEAERQRGETLQEEPQEREPQKPTPPPPPVRQEATSIPVARSVPGREGFVFSPYNNKLIDVKGFPSGTRVRDPHYPESENKFFKVP